MTNNALKDWFGIDKGYVLFSLAVGIASLLAGMAIGRLFEGIFAAFLAVALVISAATAWRYVQLRKLLGPVVVTSLVFTAGVAFVSALGLREFGLGISAAGVVGLSIISAALTFPVYLIILFVPSAVMYAVAKLVFGMLGKKSGGNKKLESDRQKRNLTKEEWTKRDNNKFRVKFLGRTKMKKTKETPQKGYKADRGFLLTFLLGYLLVSNLAFAITGLLLPGPYGLFLPFLGTPHSLFLLVVAAFEIIFLVAILLWKKWGIYGFVATRLFGIILNASLAFQYGYGLVRATALAGLAINLVVALLILKLVFERSERFGGITFADFLTAKSGSTLNAKTRGNKSYINFSLTVGVLGFLPTFASAYLGNTMPLLFMYVLFPLAAAVATGIKYDKSRYLLGPLIVYSALISVLFRVTDAYGLVSLFELLMLKFSLLLAIMTPFLTVFFAGILFVPAWISFVSVKPIIKKCKHK